MGPGDDLRLRGFGLAAAAVAIACLAAVAAPFVAVHLLSDGQLVRTIEEGGVTGVAVLCLLQLLVGILLGIMHLRRPLPLVFHTIVPALTALVGLWAARGNTYDGFQALAHAAPGDKLRTWARMLAIDDFPEQFAMLAVGSIGVYLAVVGAMTLLVRRGQGEARSGFRAVQLIGAAVLALAVAGLLSATAGIADLHTPALYYWLIGVLVLSAGLLLLGGWFVQGPLRGADTDLAGVALSAFLLCGLGAMLALACHGSGFGGFYGDTLYRCTAELSRQHATDLFGCIDRALELQRMASIVLLAPLLLLAATLHFAFINPSAPGALRRRLMGVLLVVPVLLVVLIAGHVFHGARDDASKLTDTLFHGKAQKLPPGIELPESGYAYLDPWNAEDRAVLGRVGRRTLLLGEEPRDVEDLESFKYLKQRLEQRPRPSASYSFQGPYLAAHRSAPIEPVLEVAALVELLGRCELHLLVEGGLLGERFTLEPAGERYLAGLDQLPRYLPLGLARDFDLCGGTAPPASERVAIRIEESTIQVDVGGQPQLVVERAGGAAPAMLAAKLPELAGVLAGARDVFIQPVGPMSLEELVDLLNALQATGLVRGARPVAEEARQEGGRLAERVAVLSLPRGFRVKRWDTLARKVGIEVGKSKVSRRGRKRGRRRAPVAREARITAGTGTLSGGGGVGRGQAAIDRVINLAGRRIQKCYNRLLEERPGAGGKIGVRFTIDPDGSVSACELTQNTVNDPGLGRCAVEAVRKLKFSRADKTSQVSHTFQFKDLTRR